jgi:hypothetical protein
MKENKSVSLAQARLTGVRKMKSRKSICPSPAGLARVGNTKNRGKHKGSFYLTLAGLTGLGLLLLAVFRPGSSEAQTCTNSPTQCATPGKNGAGGTLTGVVNTYFPAKASAAAGATSISLDASVGSATGIVSGDLLLVIQMQNVSINSTDTDSYGDGAAGAPASGYTNANNVGEYEYVKATNTVGTGGGTLNLTGGTGGGLINSYTIGNATTAHGQQRFQVVRVPQYTSVTLGSGLTASAWGVNANGRYCGGILAIDASTTVDLGSATVDISGLGFRGGGGVQLTGDAGGTVDYRSLSTVNCHGSKGEGIAGTPEIVYDPPSNSVLNTGQPNDGYPNGSYARGAPGNAGGGGDDDDPAANDDNSGGGGGGNGGAGGKGGLTWLNELDDGGYGGVAFAEASACRIIMGGGGGAGTRNNDDTVALASSGAAGGGIVFIRCRYVVGTGTIKANGADAFNDTLNDGGGGGGAGGTIVFSALKSLTTSTTLSNLTVSAHGGLGGDAWRTQPVGDTGVDATDNRHGPGGGGGGGRVYLSSAAASIDVSGGAHGITTTSNDTYGSVSGSAGTSTTTLTPDQITGVFSGAQCSSTAVEMVSFQAIDRRDRIHLKWRTGYEVDNVGFNVYREQDNVRTKLTPSPAAGSAFVAGPGTAFLAGRSYNWWDRLPPGGSSVQYWLEEIDLSGKRTWHGPVVPELSGQEAPVSASGIQESAQESALLSSLGRRAGPDHDAGEGLTRPLEERAVPVTPITASALSVVAQDAGGGLAAKLSVRHEGWYRVTKSDLVAAGFSPSADSRALQLFAEGAEQSILVTTDKSGYAVEFYGTGLASPYTDARVYWLSFGNQPGQRIQPATGQGGLFSPATFPYTVQRQDRSLYWVSLLNGEKENFFGDVVTNSSADEVMQLVHVDKSFGGQAQLQLAVQGFTTQPHRVSVTLNGAQVGELDFNSQTEGFATISVPQPLLVEGANHVVLNALDGDDDLSLVDYVRLTYNHTYAADTDALKFTAQGGQGVNLGGFTRSDVRVVDISKPSAPQSVAGTVAARSGGYTLTFTAPGSGPRTLLAFAGDQVKGPDAITFNKPSSWRQPANRADLVIITNRGFFNNLAPLQSLRQSQGLAVAVVDVVDLYNEFSYGEKTPQAVKDFLSFANTNWQKAPRFVLLAGHASYDPNNYLGEGYWDLVPTRLIDTQTMETASDDWFVDFSGTGYPAMAIGRLPFRTTQEADLMVSKILNYDRTFQAGGAVLVADLSDSFNFTNATHQVKALLPASMPVQEIDEDTAVSPKSVLLNSLNQGPKIVNYAGHGSVDLWRGDLLTNDDALQLANGSNLPAFIMMTCLNGYAIDPALDSLGESLLNAPGGGAVAVWASSSFTEPAPQAQLNQQLYRLLFGPAAITLGEATARAKTGVQDSDVRKTWILFGDPTMRLK